MSEDADKICRAVYLNLRIAKTLDEAAMLIRAIIGAENAAVVDGILAQDKQDQKS